MKVQELIDRVNSATNCYSIYNAEDLIGDEIECVASNLDIHEHRWFTISTSVYKLEDGYVGITGISSLKSELMGYSDCDFPCIAEEYKEFTTRKKIMELYTKSRSGQNAAIEDTTKIAALAILAELPTKNGIHIIARPFNLKEFHDIFPNINVHKNSMGTVLYIPDSLKHRYVCSECGSSNIQIQAWVDANTNEYVSDLYDNGECWCENCKKHTKLKEV